MVAMQFSFSNPEVVPEWVRWHERETSEKRTKRKSRASGRLVIEPTEGCSLMQFIKDLGIAGYELVDAFCQKRLNTDNFYGSTYRMVRFVFVRSDYVESSDNFASVRNLALASLKEMCAAALWRVRAFLNPYYQNGEEISGGHVISINLEHRQPLCSPEGGPPIMVWPRDDKGRSMKGRIGVEKNPLEPDFHLRIQKGEICFVEK
jgi:hypothetical protein